MFELFFLVRSGTLGWSGASFKTLYIHFFVCNNCGVFPHLKQLLYLMVTVVSCYADMQQGPPTRCREAGISGSPQEAHTLSTGKEGHRKEDQRQVQEGSHLSPLQGPQWWVWFWEWLGVLSVLMGTLVHRSKDCKSL